MVLVQSLQLGLLGVRRWRQSLLLPLRDDLHPVSIGVKNKCDVAHGALLRSLLELHAQLGEAIHRLREVIHEDAYQGTDAAQHRADRDR